MHTLILIYLMKQMRSYCSSSTFDSCEAKTSRYVALSLGLLFTHGDDHRILEKAVHGAYVRKENKHCTF